MKTKKIYLVESCLNGEHSDIMIDKIYANRHTAEVSFSEDYLECLRVNKTTIKLTSYRKDLIDAYSYETFSGELICKRLREVVMIMD